METRICKTCGDDKQLTLDNFQQGKNKRNGIEVPYWYKSCKVCTNRQSLAKNRGYKQRNRKKLAEAQKVYHAAHKENDSLTKKIWYQNNKEYVVSKNNKHYHDNKEEISTQRRQHRQENLEVERALDREWNKTHKELRKAYRRRERVRIQNTPELKIRYRLSKLVIYGLKRTGSSKNGESILDYLPYTMIELKAHLEKLFEPWMSWTNHGVYRADIWDDHDPSTWTWQIDHILPHSRFKYVSMSDLEFQECWALTNLRPYSAKQNVIDGDRI